jgi:ubiquinone/menaquinone biosynthesis C-methylase UbiE
MRRKLLGIYWWLKRRIAPGIKSSQCIYRSVLIQHLKRRPRWLDLGCGHQFLPDWAGVPDAELLASLPRIVGVDGNLESIQQHKSLKHRVLSDIEVLPFQAESFDLITANMVMEHVLHPERVLKEVRRVLAPGGFFIFHTPNSSCPPVVIASHTPDALKRFIVRLLEGRADEDIYSTAYQINDPRRAVQLASEAGLLVESCDLVTSEAMTAVLGPLAAFELVYIRMTQWKALAALRPDMIVVFRKPAISSGSDQVKMGESASLAVSNRTH